MHSSTVARRVDVPANGSNENATLPSGQDASLVNGGVGTRYLFVAVVAADAGVGTTIAADVDATSADDVVSATF